MKLHKLHDLFIYELQDLYDAEDRIIIALEKVGDKVSDPNLKKAINEHKIQTQKHVSRLEEIFRSIDEKPEKKICVGIKGIIDEAEELLQENTSKETLDAGLIGALQKVEHYEIASYGTAISYAELMEHKEATKLLKKTMDEEEKTNKKLTEIAKSGVNEKSMYAGNGTKFISV